MKCIRVAPVIVVRDIAASAEFWREKVGFETELFGNPPNFAMISRDTVTLMLAQAHADREVPPANWRAVDKTNQCYIWVDDVDAIYKEVQEKGVPIDFTIYNTPWGTREFGIQDLDDHDIAFGQVL